MEINRLKSTELFIREHRSNEANFGGLYDKLEEELANKNATENYVSALQQIKEKAAEEYKRAKETGGTAWPEFEKFASEFEKAVIDAK